MSSQGWDETAQCSEPGRRQDELGDRPVDDATALPELVFLLVRKVTGDDVERNDEQADARQARDEPEAEVARAEASDEPNPVLASWLPDPAPPELDVDEVIAQLRSIEEGVGREPDPPAPRRSLPRPHLRSTWPPASRSPRKHGEEPGGPAIDELLRTTLDSYRPRPARSLDEIFTGHSSYEDMRAVMSDSLPPVAFPSDRPEATGQSRLSSGQADRGTQMSDNRRQSLFFAAACVLSFSLGTVFAVATRGEPEAAAVSSSPISEAPALAARLPLRAPGEPLGADSGVATPAHASESVDPRAADSPQPPIAEAATAVSRSVPVEAKRPTAGADAGASIDPSAADASVAEPPIPSDQEALLEGPLFDEAELEGAPAPKAPSATLSAFDPQAAAAAVGEAAGRAAACGDGAHQGRARVQVTFAPSGHATSAVVDAHSKLSGTMVGSCIALTMRSAQVPPFEGELVTVSKTVHIR